MGLRRGRLTDLGATAEEPEAFVQRHTQDKDAREQKHVPTNRPRLELLDLRGDQCHARQYLRIPVGRCLQLLPRRREPGRRLAHRDHRVLDRLELLGQPPLEPLHPLRQPHEVRPGKFEVLDDFAGGPRHRQELAHRRFNLRKALAQGVASLLRPPRRRIDAASKLADRLLGARRGPGRALHPGRQLCAAFRQRVELRADTLKLREEVRQRLRTRGGLRLLGEDVGQKVGGRRSAPASRSCHVRLLERRLRELRRGADAWGPFERARFESGRHPGGAGIDSNAPTPSPSTVCGNTPFQRFALTRSTYWGLRPSCSVTSRIASASAVASVTKGRAREAFEPALGNPVSSALP